MQIGSRILIALTHAQSAALRAGFSERADEDGICTMITAYSEGVSETVGMTVSSCLGIIRPEPLPREYRLDRPELTQDMAKTIAQYFSVFETSGRVLIESNIRGLWFICPTGRRPFIGLARLIDGEPGVVQVVTARASGQEPARCANVKR